MTRLAVVATHPVQYVAPWLASLRCQADIELRVFYLWDFGVAPRRDSRFQRTVQWDLPLLEGYDHEFVPNHSMRQGTDRPTGMWNPALPGRVRSYDPDAVLLMGYNYATMYDFLMRWPKHRAPLLFRGDSHRLVPDTGRLRAVRRAFITSLFRRFQAFLYVGSANRRYFTDHGVPDERLFFAPHAVDNARFIEARGDAARAARQWRTMFGIPEDHLVVLFAGKFEPKKRPLDLLDAFIGADHPRATLLFVGAGELERQMRARATGRDDVVFAGFQNQRDMPTVYHCADVLVLPSVGGTETWGLAVNEAMCCGIPAIVSDHVGCAEDLVENDVTGLTFAAGDVRALRQALERALSDRSTLRRWGTMAEARVGRYSYGATTQGLVSALAAVRSVHVAAPARRLATRP